MITRLEAQQIMQVLATGGKVKARGEVYIDERFYGKVYSKGRPRFSGNHAFTPENTRKFEAEVSEWLDSLGVGGIIAPVAVAIVLYDRIPKSATKADKLLMEAGAYTSTVGDVDNRSKSILDAMNGVLLEDDKQINSLSVTREYDYDEGFALHVERNGFTVVELDMLRTSYVPVRKRKV